MPEINAIRNDGTKIVLEESVVEEFEQTLRGALLRKGDADYDAIRQVWNGYIDKRPALLVRCTGVADVIDAVNFA